MAVVESTCQAVNPSDGQPCKGAATTWENTFCRFHGKQCHGLYLGYKRRNARLDALSEKAPPFLKNSETPLSNESFEGLNNASALNEVHVHLYAEYVLLSKVIDARKLHHKHFYPVQMDYGHQAYLDTLSNRRHIVLRALEKLERRTAEVLYENEKWYQWIRQKQVDEEQHREKEQKKVKQEAAMFRRHAKKMQARLKAQREKEDKQRQDAFLETAYQERISQTDTDTDDEMWDPIEDVAEDERGRYIDLIKHFLWMEELPEEDDSTSDAATSNPAAETGDLAPKAKNASSQSPAKYHTKPSGQNYVLSMMDDDSKLTNEPEPSKSNIETEDELRKRLKESVENNYDDIAGPIMVGTLEMPHGTQDKTAPLVDDEIESLARDIREIKLLLFCRTLLRHASLLPAALRASSVEDFLRDPELTPSDLRDLCLEVESPDLQDIRDACADLSREDELEDAESNVEEEEEESWEDLLHQEKRHGHLQDSYWFFSNVYDRCHNNKMRKEMEEYLESKLGPRKAKMKVQVCGKAIWNYSSGKSTSRDGWLQFSVMAKDCSLRHAVELCRNWDEFSHLNFLTAWQFFPASNWVSWGSDRLTHQLHELGFFPYFKDFEADKASRHLNVGARSQYRRQHNIVESRNVIVGHMKRNDSVTRRFIQYCCMRTGELLILVRDGKTGKVVTSPSQDQLWTYREKQGLGRASKKDWDTVLEVGHEYFDMVDEIRNWHLGFDDYYDVWIWDFAPAGKGIELYNVLIEEIRKAWRIRVPLDIYKHREPFLRTLTREESTKRVRSILPDETVKSLWDEVNQPTNRFLMTDMSNWKATEVAHDEVVSTSPYLFYSEANEAEDMVLFPDEITSNRRDVPFREITNPMLRMEAFRKTELNLLTRKANRLDRRVAKRRQADDSKDASSGGESDSEDDASDDEETKSIWSLPQIWEDAIAEINSSKISSDKDQLLRKIGLLQGGSSTIPTGIKTWAEVEAKIKTSDGLEVMERDRGAAMTEAFHMGDLEPGVQEKYGEYCKLVSTILEKAPGGMSTGWVWFIAELLAWLGVRTDYDSYSHEGTAPWPHAFIVQDIVKAFVDMAMFFPSLHECTPVAAFFKSQDGQEFKESLLFKQLERSKTLPDRRTRTGFKFRPKSFWKKWDDIVTENKAKDVYYADAYPMDWSVTIRPIIAKLYRAGVIAPAYRQNTPVLVPGFATANTEPHRPDKPDLFINYADRSKAVDYPNIKVMPGYIEPSDWPDLLPIAQSFASKHGKDARFAVLRLWSAPHFYPLMIGGGNRQMSSFLDSAARSWEWKIIPKDFWISEWSIYNVLRMRLEILRAQLGDRVVHRGDVILVMGTGKLELLRYSIAVTFAIQTKPWFREIDLWKSFVDVDLEFLEGLDPYWLD
ncbi:hypothetical protein F4778DRAFT_771654 [Xylariomycetidae sp. FL2044]|nr:hypothetical protein F4778DRAFT_771654 [Xylariomycetidae sp. FL2044]